MTPAMKWIFRTFNTWQILAIAVACILISVFSEKMFPDFLGGFMSGFFIVPGIAFLFFPIYSKFLKPDG